MSFKEWTCFREILTEQLTVNAKLPHVATPGGSKVNSKHLS